MKRIRAILAALLVFTIVQAGAQTIRLRQLSVNDGLSHYDVSDIVQDRYGFIWIGTHDGLDRYDGLELRSFRHDPEDSCSIKHNRVKSLNYDDVTQELWVGTGGGGINVYDYDTDTFRHVYLTGDRGPLLPENDILDIVSEHDGRVWVATRAGLFLVSGKSSALDTLQFIPYGQGPIFKQVVQYGGTMLMAFNTELRRYLKTSDGYSLDAVLPVPQGRTNAVSVGPDGQLFVATKRYLCYAENANSSRSLKVFDFSSDITPSVDHCNCTAIAFDGAAPLVAVSGRGLYRLSGLPDGVHAEKVETDEASFWSDNQVWGMVSDRFGNIWVRSSEKGVAIVNSMRQIFRHLEQGRSSLISALFCGDDSNLWVGTNNGGLYRIESSSESVQYSVFTGSVSDIYARGNDVYACILGNVVHSSDLSDSRSFKRFYSNDGGGPLPHLGYAYSVCEDSWGSLWIGCRRGVMRVRDSRSEEVIPFDTQSPVTVYCDRSRADRMWVTSNRGGIIQIELNDGGAVDTVYHYRHVSGDPTSIPSDVIWTLHQTSAGVTYAGTDAGLCMLDTLSHTVSRLQKGSMLHNCRVLAINEDQSGVLWVNTPHGLVRYNPSDGSENLFNSLDGLSSSSMTTASAVSEDGTIYVGTNEGVNAFNPKDIQPVNQAEEILVSGLRIASIPVRAGEKIDGNVVLRKSMLDTDFIRLKHSQNSISFEVSVLSFTDRSKCRYAYRLEGYNDAWTLADASQRLVNYGRLKPGTYRFQVSPVKDTYDSLIPTKTVTVKVLPSMWQSIPAIIIYILFLVSAAIYAFVRFRQRQRLKNEEMVAEVKREMERKSNENRVRFYANITHELRTPLTLVTAPLMELETRTDLPEDVHDKILIMRRNGDRLMELVKQFLDLSRIDSQSFPLAVSHCSCTEIVRTVTSRFRMMAERKHIHFVVSCPEDDVKGLYDADKVSTVLTNLLSNAFKFTPDGGTIAVTMDKSNHAVTLKVSDTGRGIASKDLPHIFERFYQSESSSSSGTGIGLELVKLLVGIHHGSIDVQSEEGRGSVFTVWLPEGGDDKIGKEDEKDVASEDKVIEQIPVPEEAAYRKRKSVLVVEDDADMRSYICSILKDSYDVYEAEDGQDGYEKALSVMPDLIISDMMMPRLSGAEFCRKLSEDLRVSHIPVMMVSAKDAETEGLQSGAIDYILKPFVPQNLLLKVGNLMKYWDQRNLQNVPQQTTRDKIEHFQEQREREFLERAYRIVEEHIADGEFSVESLYTELAVSKTQLHNKMTALTGDSASAFIRNVRLDRAMEMLTSGQYTITEALYSVGFNSPSYFSKKFKERFGKLPSDVISS